MNKFNNKKKIIWYKQYNKWNKINIQMIINNNKLSIKMNKIK